MQEESKEIKKEDIGKDIRKDIKKDIRKEVFVESKMNSAGNAASVAEDAASVADKATDGFTEALEEFSRRGLPYGVRFRCGNFWVEKASRALSKKEAKEVRAEFLKGVPGLPKGYKGAQRASMPVIRCGDIGGLWRIEWAVSSVMFHIFDSFEFERKEDGDFIGDMTCYRLLNLMFCDTTVLGDGGYMGDKVKALNAYLGRIQAPEASEKDEERALEHMKAFANLGAMEGVGDGSQGKGGEA